MTTTLKCDDARLEPGEVGKTQNSASDFAVTAANWLAESAVIALVMIFFGVFA